MNCALALKIFLIQVLLIQGYNYEVVANSTSSKILKRGKRYLDFLKSSRMFFRANVKDNIIQVNQLWAHAFGFRANYPIENDVEHRPFRRDVLNVVEDVMNQVNVKNNILAINQIFAHAYGFRTNSPINTNMNNPPHLAPVPAPSKTPPAGKRRLGNNDDHVVKRSYIFQNLEDLMNLHSFDGRACVLKSFCEANKKTDPQIKTGMLFKLFKLIFSLQEKDRKHFSYLKEENCGQLLHQHCPLSFNSLSPYTDDI